MDENDLPARSKYKVGFAGKISPVKPVTIAESMYNRPHQEFGLGVLWIGSPACCDGAFPW